MKKIISLFLCIVLVVSMAPLAFADTNIKIVYEDEANMLKYLGLFGGTEKGYELNRVATRLEAAVMLVRLMGKEKDALAITQTEHPFTDVPKWADKYISWLYTNNIAGGTNANTFSSFDECTIQMYCTFMLRALGYSDSDYLYAEDIETATEKLIGLDIAPNTSLYRDILVHMSYNTIVFGVTKTGDMLSNKLIAKGVFTNEQFKQVLSGEAKKVDLYLQEMSTANQKDMYAFEMQGSGSMVMSDGNQSQSATFTMLLKTIINNYDKYKNATSKDIENMLGDMSMYSESTTSTDAETAPITSKMYMKDGFLYIDDGQFKTKVNFSEETAPLITDILNSLEPISDNSAASIFAGARKFTKGDVTRYTFIIDTDNLFNSSVMDSVPQESSDAKFLNYSITYCIKDSALCGLVLDYTIETQGITISYSMEYSITKINEEVSITPPADLDQYVEMESLFPPYNTDK